jgi:hypothetical protein
MSRYDWPTARDADAAHGGHDDAAGRLRYTARLRVGLGQAPEGAIAASRRTPTRPADAPGVLRAPASGRQHLWQSLGPQTVLGGQAEGRPRVCGRVNAIAVHSGGQRIYAASANGGVWYSKDGGAHWVSVAGLASTNTAGIVRPAQRNACGAIHVEFGTNEGEDLVFLGTGEVTSDPDGQPGSAERGIGILVGDQPVKSAQPDPWVREAPNLVNNGIYRIVREPGGGAVIAATRTGLYQRPGAPGANVDWVRPTATPFDTLNVPCTDVLWTAAEGTSPARLWVWVEEGDNAGLWVRDAGAANFEKVAVAAASPYAYTARRATLAAATPPTQIWVLNDRGASTLPALLRVSNPAAPTRPEALGVIGVPNVLRNQGFYDIAIAVDPGNANRIVVAGSWLNDVTPDGAQGEYNASIVVADVAVDPGSGGQLRYGHPTAYTMIGLGVHPDVQGLAFSNAGATLWACCDGGVFRSDRPARPAGFYACNHGLSTSESNYIACNPKLEGHVVAGLQDNGTIERSASGVWKEVLKGDGGGIAMDMARPDRWLAQYTNGKWRDSQLSNVSQSAGDAWAGPTLRAGSFVQPESNNAAFYSGAAAIAHVRNNPPAAAVPIGQILLGTHRPWFSDDFGATWVTLPTATDPLPGNATQDSIGEKVTVCRWQDPDTAWVLGESKVHRFTRTPGSHNGGGPGAWAGDQTVIRKNVKKNKKDATSADDALRKSPTWTDIAPNVLPGPPVVGALYMGTVGHAEDAQADTLWWFDGDETWHKTGLRTVVPAPVIAIAVDPALPNEVWVGTTVGVWQGARSAGPPPTWTWQQFVNGLPEAAVEDLAIFSDGGLRLLRAAIASRGVWELRLDVADVDDLAYLRVHDDDLRHRLPSITLQRDGVTARSWHGSPDVRPRVAPSLVAAPATLPWRRTTAGIATDTLRRFQTALRASTNDPRVVANGLWDPYFSEVLRDHGAPTVAVPAAPPLPALNMAQIDKPFWDQHMKAPHATAEPWGAGPPTEADLHEYTPELREGDPGRTSCELQAAPCKVDVVVHHRGLAVRAGADVRVTLLKWIDPKKKNKASFSDPSTWFTGDVPWTAAVNEVLNSASGAAPGPLTAGWSFVGSTNATRRVTLTGQTLDPLNAGVATFDLNLSGLKNDTVVLLVAVVRAGGDIALNAAPLQQLILNNPQVAVRSVRVRK